MWEYARESHTLREEFHGIFMDGLVPFTLETSFLSAIRFGMGSFIGRCRANRNIEELGIWSWLGRMRSSLWQIANTKRHREISKC